MIKSKILTSLLIIASVAHLVAQPYGNEWIDLNKSYFKIKIGTNGIYRITQSELLNAGFPATSIDPRKLQLYSRGQEVAIEVRGQDDGVFHASDYIQFYGEINDGKSDTELYTSPDAQPHTHFNLFSDSAAYFLTYRLDLDNGQRLSKFSENNVTAIPADNYYTEERLDLKLGRYSEGQRHGSGNIELLPIYDYGEGWTGTYATLNQSLTYTLADLNQRVEDGVDPHIEVLLVGGNNNQHNIDVFIGPDEDNLRLIETAEFVGYTNYEIEQSIEWSDISATGNLVVRATINGVNGAADRASISLIILNYTRGFDINEENTVLKTKINPSDKSYIEVSNPPADAVIYDITDRLDPIEIGYNDSFAEINAIIPNTSSERTLYIHGGPLSVATIEPVEFIEIDPSVYNYLLVTSDRLRKPTTSGVQDPILAYKAYRQSTEGGGFTVLDMDIEKLFDQFNYGHPSPLAIRHFCEFMYDGGDPEYLFIVGKASNVPSLYYRQDPNAANVVHFVPTYGFPGSDVPFTIGFDGSEITETIPTGRLNATKPDHIEAYLNKVMEKESMTFDDLRNKNMLFLSGGRTDNEQRDFKTNIDNYKDQIEKKFLGGLGKNVSKVSNSSTEFINISEEINDGVAMVTFFGHSATTVTDIEIGNVSDPTFGYANKGKYPVFLVNGCNAGDFFSETQSFGVDWILTRDLGAVGFMAHSYKGLSNQLDRYSEIYFENSFENLEFIDKSVGQVRQKTAQDYVDRYGANSSAEYQTQCVNLQGDPAIRVFPTNKPDLAVDANNVLVKTFNNEQLLASTESFYLEFDIKNFGVYSESQFLIQVERTFADGTKKIYEAQEYDPVLRQDTLTFVIDNLVDNPIGRNTFSIQLDPFEFIEEIDETNNQATFDLFLSSGSTLNLLPSDYSIVNAEEIGFVFQSTDALVGTRSFSFELDTVNTFNSPILFQEELESKTVVNYDIASSVLNNVPDGKVVYWRTKFTNPLPQEGTEWVQSSFVLNRTQSEGWMQSDVAQLSELNITGMVLDPASGSWSFNSQTEPLEVNVFGANHPTAVLSDTKVALDGLNYFNSTSGWPPCQSNTINFVAFDRQSNVPYNVLPIVGADVLNRLVCGVRPQIVYNFIPDDFDEPVFSPQNFIEEMANSDNVVVFSLGTVAYSTWPEDFKDQLELIGADRSIINDLADGEPLIIFGKKGAAANSATVIRAATDPKNEQALVLNDNVEGNFDTGQIKTRNIGPATSWESAEINLQPSANPSQDQRSIKIIGIDDQDQEVTLIEDDTETSFDLTSIDASTYPTLRLELSLADNDQFTPEQLQSWQVIMEPSPEGVLLKSDQEGTNTAVSKEEGEPFESVFTFWNVSDKDFDGELEVITDLQLQGTDQVISDTIKIAGPAKNDSVNFTVNIATLGNSGMNDLIMTVNKADQSELYLSNNNIRISDFLSVKADESHPILDVSFDGKRIMDGDLVSPTPYIQVMVKDDNQFLLKEDTVGVNLHLRYPCENCDYERIAFSDPRINWSPATESQPFEASLQTEPLEDGIHAFKVQATDASGNASGIQPYEINFEVINESTITNFYPYPNPFSTSCQFVFTLTGSEIPEDIKIQIMTVSGRVVREIFMDELGSITIGNNLTDFRWDGTDRYGDQLANGVYLYRVLIKNPGENFQHRETSADRGFKNGFGKLYILR